MRLRAQPPFAVALGAQTRAHTDPAQPPHQAVHVRWQAPDRPAVEDDQHARCDATEIVGADHAALDFSREERELYGAIEAGIQAKVSKYLRAGTLMQNSGHAFVLLLRLRQAVIHPALCQKDAEEAVRPHP